MVNVHLVASPFVARASSGHAVILCAYYRGIFRPYCNVLFSKHPPLSPYESTTDFAREIGGRLAKNLPICACPTFDRCVPTTAHVLSSVIRSFKVFKQLYKVYIDSLYVHSSGEFRFFLFYFIQDIQVCKPNRFIFFCRIF